MSVAETWKMLGDHQRKQFELFAGRQRTPPRMENIHYTEFPCIRYIKNNVTGEFDSQVINHEDAPVPEGFTEYRGTSEGKYNYFVDKLKEMRLRSEEEYQAYWYSLSDDSYKDQEAARCGAQATSALVYAATAKIKNL